MSEEVFLRPVFKGARFQGGHLPLEVVGELGAYRKLVLAVAKHLFKVRHRHRQRAPKGFEQQLQLWFRHVEDGSAIPVVMRSRIEQPAQQLKLVDEDYFEEAQLVIAAQIEDPTRLHARFPSDVLRLFNGFGATLRDDESLELDIPNGPRPTYDRAVRKRLVLLRDTTYEDEIEVVGFVEALDVQRLGFTLRLASGESVPGSLSPESIPVFREVLGRASMPIQLVGTGRRNQNDQLLSISCVDEVVLHQDVAHLEALDVEKRLEVLASLEPGWLHGHGEPIPHELVVRAVSLLSAMEAEGCVRAHLYPTEDGGLQAEWSFPDAEVSVELLPHVRVATFLGVDLRTGADREEEVSLEDPVRGAAKLAELVMKFAPTAAVGVSA